MENINKFFGNIPIYIINLKDSIERKENILKQIGEYKNLHFVEAVDGRNTENFYKKYNASYKSNINQKTAIYAVFCSHIKALFEGLKQENEWICVLEDDVCFDLIKKYNKILYTLDDVIGETKKNNVDCVQLFYIGLPAIEGNFNNTKNKELKLVERKNAGSGTAYIINKQGINIILSTIKSNGNNKFIYRRNFTSPESNILAYLKTYVVNIPIIYYYIPNDTTYAHDKNDLNALNYAKISIKKIIDNYDLIINK